MPGEAAERPVRDHAAHGRAWAIADVPGQPSLRDANPSAVDWRGVLMDPDLGGPVPERGRPSSVRIGHEGSLWTLPVARVLVPQLAWHPRRPLVAGLATRGRSAYPWVADYAARQVTTFDDQPAAVGFLGEGGRGLAPVTWLDDDHILVLVPADRPGPTVAQPTAWEAVGPGFLSFEPDIEQLTATSVAALDVTTGATRTLTPPALIRGLRPSPDGRFVLLDQWPAGPTTLLTVETAEQEPMPDGVRWVPGSTDVLSWGVEARAHFRPAGGGTEQTLPVPTAAWWPLWHNGTPALLQHNADAELVFTTGEQRTSAAVPPSLRFAPTPPVWAGGSRLVLRCRDRAGTSGRATVDLEHSRVDVTWDQLPPAGPAPKPLERLTIDTGHAEATLTLGPSRSDQPPALLLWIHAAKAGEPETETTAPLTGEAWATLRLPLHWPADADVPMLRRQIVETVHSAYEMIRKEHDGAVVVGGHSFGATLALCALAELPDDFSAAIAHSGCYNRTSTPTGFQYERRSYWAVPEIYAAFSALRFADRLTRPVLIVHGVRDANPATTPDQATELYRAIVATGGHARLLLLPEEGHTFRYRENLQALAAEHERWQRNWDGRR
ncbi:alpha/beta hydrolase family protein [Actinoplanes solisilvae]|uniref:alpha/beta hydrolase family protein n=1 Tax=Actinoplanes solisilvae TaxID=2486853 RepID=UPI000FD7A76F|nr:prolyl oligopeptidase family serine peptidase [Actinoplanes solisilvae]